MYGIKEMDDLDHHTKSGMNWMNGLDHRKEQSMRRDAIGASGT